MKIHFPRRRFFASLFALAMVLCLLTEQASAASSAEIKTKLDKLKQDNAQIQNQINSVRGQYDRNASEIKGLVDKKNGVDQEIALLHEHIDNVNEQINVLVQMIADSQEELETAQQHLDDLNLKHKQRIQAMEEDGTVSYWQVLFESTTIVDFLDRVNMVEEIAASDRRRLDEMQDAAQVVRDTQDQMNEELALLSTSRTELEDAQMELEDKRSESDSVLRQLALRQEEYKDAIAEAVAMKEDLLDDIAKVQKEYQTAKYNEDLVRLALQGKNPPSNAKWITPVSGYVISSPFGNRKAPLSGASTNHKGIDMACPQGTPIYATRAGTVVRAAYQAGGAGYYVSLSHGDGFASIYMHMTRYVVSNGQSVSAGQLIGYVGSTGNSTGPHLHFGVSYGGTYVNPLAYIN